MVTHFPWIFSFHRLQLSCFFIFFQVLGLVLFTNDSIFMCFNQIWFIIYSFWVIGGRSRCVTIMHMFLCWRTWPNGDTIFSKQLYEGLIHTNMKNNIRPFKHRTESSESLTIDEQSILENGAFGALWWRSAHGLVVTRVGLVVTRVTIVQGLIAHLW